MSKRGQIAIFVIIAVVLVAVIALIFFAQRLNLGIGPQEDINPTRFLRDCISPDIQNAFEKINNQGGSIEPNNYVLFEDKKVQYLCYTSQDYKPCIVQQPLLVKHIEEEVKKEVKATADSCVNELKSAYESRGYEVTNSPGEINVSLIPGSLNIEFLSPMTITKDSTQTFRKFGVSVDTEIYDLLLVATSIVQFESTLGDSEPLLYIQYYPNLKIEKINKGGDTIYRLSDVASDDQFTFATRSLVWPPGYGLENSI